MDREWRIKKTGKTPEDLLNAVDQNPILASYLLERGITTGDQARHYLEPDWNDLSDPFELPGMDKAIARLETALHNHEVIGIWGDFDVDGQTATAILVECLEKLGAVIRFYLPVRGKESHGISLPSLQAFMKTGIQLLITCDTGISEHESIQYAMENGLDVIVTDHHSLPEVLPPALVCINPHCLPEHHALETISGSAVAFEVMLALCRTRNCEYVATESLDLAALGLIADLAPLKSDARLIAQLGLQTLSENPRQWVKALFNAAGMAFRKVDEQTIGFVIAPRLNASGRLEDANSMVDFLLDRQPETLQSTADRLEALNANRKWLLNQVYQSASHQFKRQTEIKDDPVVILTNPGWPGGVLGLAAGHLVDDVNRPVILLNESADGILRGSARSTANVNISEALTSTTAFLLGSGGHAGAAGLSLRSENLNDFRREINIWVRNHGLAPFEKPPLEIDAELAIPQISDTFYASIQRLAPFGNANPPLTFCCRGLQITSIKALGKNREHFKFKIQDKGGNTLPLVWWNAEENLIPGGMFDLAFTLNENTYKGETTLQAEWVEIHPVEEPEIAISRETGLIVQDLRLSAEPIREAIELCAGELYMVFQEPPELDNAISMGRKQLHKIKNLVMASIPPTRTILEDCLREASPRQLILAFPEPVEINLSQFVNHLAGLIQYAVKNRDGLVNLIDIARAMNQTEDLVQIGLTWMRAAGKINMLSTDQDLTRIEICSNPADNVQKIDCENQIRYALLENHSFRKFLYQQPAELFKNYSPGK